MAMRLPAIPGLRTSGHVSVPTPLHSPFPARIGCVPRSALRGCLLIVGALLSASCARKPALPDQWKEVRSNQIVHITAQIVRKSEIPDPLRSDYADCLYTAEVKIVGLARSDEKRAPREMVLALPAFQKRQRSPEADFAAGELIDAEIVPHEDAPEVIKTMQRSDQMDRFELRVYDVVRSSHCAKALADFRPLPDSAFLPPTDEPVATAEPAPVHYPWSAKAASDRRQCMERDIAMLQNAFARHGSDWGRWDNELDPFYTDLETKTDAAAKGQLIQGHFGFHRLPLRKYKGLCEDGKAGVAGPLTMLKSMNEQLRQRGIDLIVVPFPTKEDVDADVFSNLAPADGWYEPYREQFMLLMLQADIEVIDLVPALRAERAHFPFLFYDYGDDHPADGAIQVAATEIAKRLQRYDLREGAPPLDLHLEPAEVERNGGAGLMHYPATRVVTQDGKPLFTPDNSGSPVIIMGDSYTRIPHRYLAGGDGCAMPMHLAYKIGILPDSLAQMGGSNQAMRLLAREGGNYLAHRRVLVFVFAHTRLFGALATGDSGSWDLTSLPPLKLEK